MSFRGNCDDHYLNASYIYFSLKNEYLSMFQEQSASQDYLKAHNHPDTMMLTSLALVLLVSTPGLPQPIRAQDTGHVINLDQSESRQRRQTHLFSLADIDTEDIVPLANEITEEEKEGSNSQTFSLSRPQQFSPSRPQSFRLSRPRPFDLAEVEEDIIPPADVIMNEESRHKNKNLIENESIDNILEEITDIKEYIMRKDVANFESEDNILEEIADIREHVVRNEENIARLTSSISYLQQSIHYLRTNSIFFL